MKLAELKEKFHKKYVIRIVAGVLTVALVGGSSATAYNVYAAKTTAKAEEETTEESSTKVDSDVEEELKDMLSDKVKVNTKDIGKDETVYVIADATGKAKSTIVSEWLKNPDKKDTLEDASDLDDIENVKGDETFDQKGSTLTWKADGNDIYYQGTTKKETPVTQKITYYLDGKEIAPEDLAGKSGKVKIRFDYTNNAKTTATINGKSEEINVPFVVVSGMLLDDGFSNVEVTNGKVISNGDKDVVMGVAMPGLKDSLNVKDSDFSSDISIPDYVEVTADVENFEMGMTMSVVSSSSDLSIDSELDFSDLDDKIDDLTDAVGQLKDGSGELADGLDTLQSNMKEFSDGMKTLQTGLTAYTNGAKDLADGLSTLKSQTTTLISGVGDLQSSVTTLNNGVKTLDKAVNTKMTNKEKSSAQSQAVAAVDAQFADDNNASSYNNIKSQAESTFYNGIVATKDAAVAQAQQSAAATVQSQADAIGAQASQQAQQTVSAAADQQIAAKMGEVQAGLQAQIASINIGSSEAAGQLQQICMLAAKGQNPDADEATIAAAGNAMYEAVIAGLNSGVQQQVGATVSGAVSGLSGDLKNTIVSTAAQVADQTARSTATQVAGQVAGTVAGTVVESVASQAKGTVGEAVAGAAKTAAETAAGQAAVSGAESAKQLIAQSIEKKDEKSGYSLVSGMDTLNTAVNGMSGKMPTLSDGIDKLYNGSQTLASKNDELNSGMSKLVSGTGEVVDGVDKLASGSHDLADGIVKFDEEGIEKLINSYNGDVKDLVDRIQAVMDAGSEYESFGGKADATTGSVKIIIKTDAIKAEN